MDTRHTTITTEEAPTSERRAAPWKGSRDWPQGCESAKGRLQAYLEQTTAPARPQDALLILRRVKRKRRRTEKERQKRSLELDERAALTVDQDACAELASPAPKQTM